MEPVKNRKAFFDYEILETLEVGIVLEGHEVKSMRQGGLSLKDSYVICKDEEFWLLNGNITQYRYVRLENYDPARSRKLLASKKQILSWASKMKQANLTIVPLKAYAKGKRIKLEIGLAKGKKKHDKKEAIKKRELERELHREKREIMI